MKIAVWRTNHEIADTVAKAVCGGLQIPEAQIFNGDYGKLQHSDIHIGYGILRGTGDIFKWCSNNKKPYFCLDRGYWKPNHYDGFYRISLNGTQQTTGIDKLQPNYERWDRLGLEILPYEKGNRWGNLVCPPTDYVENYMMNNYGIKPYFIESNTTDVWRFKGCERPLQSDLDHCEKVITFNSSVGWEALRQGIPVVSDPDHSIVGAFQKTLDFPLHADYDARKKLFAVQAGLQLTLDEVRSGKLWPLLQRLLAASQ